MRELWFDFHVVLSYVGVVAYVAVFIYVLLGFFRTVDQYREAKEDVRNGVWEADKRVDLHADGLKLGVWVLLWVSGIIAVIAYVMRDDLFPLYQFIYWL